MTRVHDKLLKCRVSIIIGLHRLYFMWLYYMRRTCVYLPCVYSVRRPKIDFDTTAATATTTTTTITLTRRR